MLSPSFRRIYFLLSFRRVQATGKYYGTLNSEVKLKDIPEVCSREVWNDTVQECRSVLESTSTTKSLAKSKVRGLSAKDVLKRLQGSSGSNAYLIETFKELLSCTSTSTNGLRWPGLIVLALSKAVGNSFLNDSFISKALEDMTWSSQVTLAEVTNLFYCKLLFRKENQRLNHSTSASSKDHDRSFASRTQSENTQIARLVDRYFTTFILQNTFALGNEKVLLMTARVLESFAKNGPNDRSEVLPSLHSWELETFYPQGLIMATGCQSALEIAGFSEMSQELAFKFGQNFTLAIKANGDIQQFWNYQQSRSSFISLSGLPVALHLENNPETLAYLYSCSQKLDNLDYSQLNSMLMKNVTMDEARQQLQIYVQTAVDVLHHIENSKNSKIFQYLIKLIKTLENIEE